MPTDGDTFVHRLDELDTARRKLIVALTEFEGAIDEARRARMEGRPLSESIRSPGNGPRRRVASQLARMQHAMMAARAEFIRLLVEEEGHSLSEVGRMLGQPRQLVTRLYRRAGGPPPPRRGVPG